MASIRSHDSFKRNFSSSSIIQKQKSNTFVSPNRFSNLPVDDNLREFSVLLSVTVLSTIRPESKMPPLHHISDEENKLTNKKKLPPIFMINVTNYSALKTDLISLVSTDSFTATANSIIIINKKRSCIDNYKIIDYCNESNLTVQPWSPFKPIQYDYLSAIYIILFPLRILLVLRDLDFFIINVC